MEKLNDKNQHTPVFSVNLHVILHLRDVYQVWYAIHSLCKIIDRSRTVSLNC